VYVEKSMCMKKKELRNNKLKFLYHERSSDGVRYKRILHVRAHKYRGDEKRSAMKMSRCDGKTRVKKN